MPSKSAVLSFSLPFRYDPARYMPFNVAVIGAGEMGSAMAVLLQTAGARVEKWDKDPHKHPKQKPLADVLRGADAAFLCVASWHLRDAVADMRPHLSKKTVILSLSKGMELGTGLTTDGILAETLPRGHAFGLLSGPMLAEEIIEGLPTGAALATAHPKAFQRLIRVLSKSSLHVSLTRDVRGTAFSGVLKNVYALSLGITDALSLGANAKGWFVQRALEEMRGIVRTLHPSGDAEKAAHGLAGLGDLVATGISHYSSNFTVGRELVAGKGITKMSEGFISLPSLRAKLGKKEALFPLFHAVAGIVIDKKNTRKTFAKLMK